MAIAMVYLIIMIVVAALVLIISVVSYNRRLDKIARGEARDTHSSIPEPKETVNGIYRVLLMGLVVVCLVNIGTANGMLISLQNEIHNLESRQQSLSAEIREMREQLKENETLVSDASWEVTNGNLESRTADIDFTVRLKQFSEETKVTLNLGGKEVPLTGNKAGTFKGQFSANLFEEYSEPAVCISEGGVTVSEAITNFPEYFLYDYLPMPSVGCSMSSNNSFGKMKYEGTYTLYLDHKEEIESVTVTYMTGGKDLKTLDVTKEALAGEEITLEKGLPLEKDLTFRTEIKTKSGFTIEEQSVMIFMESVDIDEMQYLRIYDESGEIVWEDDYK